MDVLESLARSQRRVALTEDLLQIGLDLREVRRLHRRGRLVRLVHGGYAIGPLEEPEERLVLRVLTRRYPRGAASCETALAALGCPIPFPPVPHLLLPPDHEPVSGTSFRSHCTRWPIPLTMVDGIPVVTGAVALIGAWSDLSASDDRRSVVAAAITSATTSAAAVTAQDPGRRRVRGARALLGACALAELGCESAPEMDYLVKVERSHGLPVAERQAWIDLPGGRRRRVDVLYRTQRVIVEVDGSQHRIDAAIAAADRENDTILRAMGYVVLRFSWDDIRHRPAWVAATVRAVLAAAA